MSRVGKIIGSCIGIAMMIAMLVMAVVYGYKSRSTEDPCSAIHFIIEDRDERLYVTDGELASLLKAEDIYPVGRKINLISLQRIENAILHHPMVRTAECYMTPTHVVKVRLTQRVPILRVQTPIDSYLIDTDRKVMQDRQRVTDNVLRVTGTIGVQMACGKMADLAFWLVDEDYWQDQIDHVYVKSPQMIYLYLKDSEQPRIVLGNMQGYEQKLAKLRTFMRRSAPEIKEKNYTELDLRYRGQVIGRYE